MAEEAVKVAVRVRPFNKREKEANSKLCVAMSGATTIITNPDNGEEKKYAYDFSYWSHDGFTEEANGYNRPDGNKYIDQKQVYSDLGVGVLKNAWLGYNASLFAYGQTGSGKSYSVVGYGENKGIVPLVCEDIFKTAATITDKTIEVYFSMLEIYSEIVRDLLSPAASRKSGLQIRQDPKNGFYAQGLTKSLVSSYEGIVKLTDEGTANRTIAATNMNATSSRAHTIVTVTLLQKYKNDAGQEMTKSSMINLVDLAGSERADATGATGDRLKEGAAINLSLTSLGNVISALADNSAGKNVKVPYRDSSLTKLLMNALGGNSKTIMIAAISPADINFAESVSTLRYADRAKQIKTKAAINEDPTEKLIRDLKEENARLKAMLAGGKIDPSLLSTEGSKTDLSDAEKAKEIEALKKQMEDNEKEMDNMEKTYEEKLAAALANQSQKKNDREELLEKAKTVPHLSNLNMDPSLSGTLKLLLEGNGTKTVGVPKKADIGLFGIGILDPHATITHTGEKFTIEKCADAKILRNGRPITGITELAHLDRLVFGCSQYYLFVNPAKASDKDQQYTFEMAQDEIGKASGTLVKDTRNMSQDEILCMTEMMDLLPQIDEANLMSITLDKKVKFSALAVSSASRGDYDAQSKAYVTVKNFALGLEWVWTKNKFLDRKVDMSEFYLDFKEDGKIDKEKYLKYDPFAESPDTPTQVGTAMLYPKSFAYMISFKGDFKVLDFKSKEAGALSVDIVPCQSNGTIIDPSKTNMVIRNPEKELLNKTVNFIIKINNATGLSDKFEDIYCQFQVFNDPTVYKTEVIRGTHNPEFKFSKQFTFTATDKFLDYILNKPLYIQVWSEQKHPKPKKSSQILSTKEYFEREKEMSQATNISGKSISNKIDPEKESLKTEIDVLREKEQKANNALKMIQKLVFVAKDRPIPGSVITAVVNASNNEAADKKIREFFESKPTKSQVVSTKGEDGEDIISELEDELEAQKKKYEEVNKELADSIAKTNSQACSIL